MPGPELFGLFLVAALVMVVSPGPSNFYVMARTVAQGMRGGVLAAAGLAAGAMVHVIAAAAGISIILQHSPVLFTAMKVAGAVYLIWLGVTQILASLGTIDNAPEIGNLAHRSDRRILTEGALVEFLNPKVALFFLAFLPQFVDPAAGAVALQFLVLGGVFMLLAFISDLGYVLAAGRAARLFRESDTARRLQDWLSGSVLIGLGGYMLFDASE